jgi:hypothetical protein
MIQDNCGEHKKGYGSTHEEEQRGPMEVNHSLSSVKGSSLFDDVP